MFHIGLVALIFSPSCCNYIVYNLHCILNILPLISGLLSVGLSILQWLCQCGNIYIYIYIYVCVCVCVCVWAGWPCRYSDWLRAGRSGIKSRWRRDFPPVQTGPGAHPASCKMGTWSFPGVKFGRCVLLTTHPLLVPRSWKSRAIPLPNLWVTPGL